MRLLICTQAVDQDDPVLGFFHRWIEKLAAECEVLHVICLKKGRYTLPSNVHVHSLGKEEGRSLMKYLSRFYRYIWTLRHEYDNVFVHMNQEYVLLGGGLWWSFGKRIILWRNHARGSLLTRIASELSQSVCYTSPSSYTASYKNAIKMPIGIDTEVFVPAHAVSASVLFLGRLDRVKNPELFIDSLKALRANNAHVDVYGSPTDGNVSYEKELKKRAESLLQKGVVAFHPAVSNEKAPAIYASHAVYVNLTPSGSFDKTIGEAMACGCIVVAANEALRGVIPSELLVSLEPASIAAGIQYALDMDPSSRAMLAEKSRLYVVENHALSLLVSRLVSFYKRNTT